MRSASSSFLTFDVHLHLYILTSHGSDPFCDFDVLWTKWAWYTLLLYIMIMFVHLGADGRRRKKKLLPVFTHPSCLHDLLNAFREVVLPSFYFHVLSHQITSYPHVCCFAEGKICLKICVLFCPVIKKCSPILVFLFLSVHWQCDTSYWTSV